jgi:hypothetical protein
MYNFTIFFLKIKSSLLGKWVFFFLLNAVYMSVKAFLLSREKSYFEGL